MYQHGMISIGSCPMFDMNASKYFNDQVDSWCTKNRWFYLLSPYRHSVYEDLDRWEELIRKILLSGRFFRPEQLDPRALMMPNIYLTIGR